MKDERQLIYLNDYYHSNEGIVVKYEIITDDTIGIVNSGNYIEENEELLEASTSENEVTGWLDSFLLFDNEINLATKGFKNVSKGGANTKARKLIEKLKRSYKEIDGYIKPVKSVNVSNLKKNDKWFLCVITVGQGECNLIISPYGLCYMFDGGNGNQKAKNKITKVIDHLNNKHNYSIVDEISGFFISHSDNDHFRGVVDAIEGHRKSKDCFLYFNYLSFYPKNNWNSAMVKIIKQLNNGNLNYVIEIPKLSDLSNLSSIIPGLNYEQKWPYDNNVLSCISNKISCNDSSHCILFSTDNSKYIFNLFGDSEKYAWNKVGLINNNEFFHDFIFKLTHHGRDSGDPVTSYSNFLPINEFISNNLNVKHYLSSSETNNGINDSPTAKHARYTSEAKLALIYEFDHSNNFNIDVIN